MVEKTAAIATTILVLSLGVAAGPARAQWPGYSGYQQQPYRAYPYYPDDRRPPAYRGQRYSYAEPGDPYSSGPFGGREDRESFELGVRASERTAAVVRNPTNEAPGTIVIDTHSRHLYLVRQGGEAIQYGIGVGRQGFDWRGIARVGRKAEWPRWIPPKEMLKRRPDLPESMDGGLENPLGARALYLFQGNKDTLFRIHGTNEPDTIGKAVSSGCIRMMNADVINLFGRVPVGTRVVVM
jgi:hypothetical protein